MWSIVSCHRTTCMTHFRVHVYRLTWNIYSTANRVADPAFREAFADLLWDVLDFHVFSTFRLCVFYYFTLCIAHIRRPIVTVHGPWPFFNAFLQILLRPMESIFRNTLSVFLLGQASGDISVNGFLAFLESYHLAENKTPRPKKYRYLCATSGTQSILPRLNFCGE